MTDRDVSAPYIDPLKTDAVTPAEDRPADASNFDADGYDEAQRAEIAAFEGGGDSNGDILTDMAPDMGEDLDDDEIEDDADELPDVIDTDR